MVDELGVQLPYVLGEKDKSYYLLGSLERYALGEGAVIVFEDGTSPDRFRARLAELVGVVPRLRQVIRRGSLLPGDLRWVDDPSFDIDDHFVRLRLADPTRRGLGRLVSWLQSAPFSPDRSPWDVALIDGIEGKRCAMLRVHHVMADGLGTARLAHAIFSDDPVSIAASGIVTEVSSGGQRRQIQAAASLLSGAIDGLSALRSARVRKEQLRTIRAIAKPVHRSNGPRTTRTLMAVRVSQSEWRRIAKERKGGANELLLAVMAAVLTRCSAGGHSKLRVIMPVGQGAAPSGSANRQTDALLELPCFGAVPSDLSELRSITDEAKRSAWSTQTEPSAVQAIIALAPDGVAARSLARLYSHTDCVASYLPALAAGNMTLDGAPAEEIYPFTVALGNPITAAVLPYRDTLAISVNIDTGQVRDAGLVWGELIRTLDDLGLGMREGFFAYNALPQEVPRHARDLAGDMHRS